MDKSLKIFKILQHLISKNLISPQQHGFRLKSTATNLLECLYYNWTSSQQRRQQTDIIYFDSQRAFDSVSRQKLLNKVQSHRDWFSNHSPLGTRTFSSKLFEFMFIRPLLECSCQVWNLSGLITNTWLRALKRFKRNLSRPFLGLDI